MNENIAEVVRADGTTVLFDEAGRTCESPGGASRNRCQRGLDLDPRRQYLLSAHGDEPGASTSYPLPYFLESNRDAAFDLCIHI